MVLGFVIVFGFIGYVIVIGSEFGGFINFLSMMIVFGGIFGVTMVNYPMFMFMGAMKVCWNAFFI